MIFVDTNVFMHAVGREHPLQGDARDFFRDSLRQRTRLVTSSEVLQELLHAYLPAGRMATFDSAMILVGSSCETVWPVEPEDVRLARALVDDFPSLRSRDLLHLASCQRREVSHVKTYDRPLSGAFRT